MKLIGRIQKAIEDKMVPGMGIVYGKASEKNEIYVGKTTYEDDGMPVSAETIYDVASVTKLFTASAILQLISQSKLHLEDSIGKILDAPAINEVQIIHALSHTSAIAIKFSNYKDDPQTLKRLALTTAPNKAVGTIYEYGNINYYLLGLVLEKHFGKPIDIVLNDQLFIPLGMTDTCFKPAQKLWPLCAPTEIDSWRNKIVQGFVHDESTYAFGGATGYAGAFSTAQDLFKFGLLYLNKGLVEEKQLIDKKLLQRSVEVTFPNALTDPIRQEKLGFSGFRINSRSRLGKRAGQRAYEFSGFTGPSIMIDPGRDLVIAFVDNRTYPKRPDNFDKLIQFRTELFEIIDEELGK